MVRRRSAVLFFLVVYAVAAQPVHIAAGAGLESETIDTSQLGRSSDYYSKLFLTWFGSIDGEFGKTFSYRLKYQHDPFWQNTVNVGVGYTFGVFNAGLGFLAGLPDSDLVDSRTDLGFWNFGIDGLVKLEFPGIFFVKANVILSAGSQYAEKVGVTNRFLVDASAGFWLPHIVVSAGHIRRGFDEYLEDNLFIKAEYFRYYGKLAFFAKNIPFTFEVQVGQVVQKGSQRVDNVESSLGEDKTYYFINGYVKIDFTNKFALFFGTELPFFNLAGFSVSSGIIISIPGNE